MTPPLSASAALARASEDVFTPAPLPLVEARELAAEATRRGLDAATAALTRRHEWDHDIPFMRQDVWACSLFGPDPMSRAVVRVFVEFEPRSAVVRACFVR